MARQAVIGAMKFSIRQKGYIFITIAMVELSLLTILSSIGAKNIGTVQLLFFVFLAATITSLLVVLYMKKTTELKRLLLDRRSLTILAIAGILNYAGAQLFLTIGVVGTNPIVTSILLKLWPIFLAIMIPFTIKTKVRWPQMLALLIAFGGVYIILTNGSLISINVQELPFIGFVILSTLCTASSNVMIKGQNHDIYSEVFLFNLASLVLVVLLIPLLGVHLSLSMNTPSIISILFLGIITYSIGSLLFFYTLKALDPLVAANASYSTPFLTIVFSFLILGTPLQAYYLYALALIICALVIQDRYSKKAPEYVGTKKKHEMFFYDVTGAFVENTHPQIYTYIKGNGRVLATKISTASYSGPEGKNNYGCLVFTNREHPDSVNRQEIEFIENIMGPSQDELVLMAAGSVDSVEQALGEYTKGEVEPI